MTDQAEKLLRTARVTVMKMSSIMECPHTILVPEHYRSDGRCRCDDPKHKVMADWGYRWNAKKGRWV